MAEDLHSLLDGKLPLLAIFPKCLIDTSIRTTADETNNVVSLSDMDLTCVSTAGSAGICEVASQHIVKGNNARSST